MKTSFYAQCIIKYFNPNNVHTYINSTNSYLFKCNDAYINRIKILTPTKCLFKYTKKYILQFYSKQTKNIFFNFIPNKVNTGC